jgi:hypothetical protein
MGNFFSDNTEKITNNTEDNNILQTDVASNMIIDTYNTYNSHTDNIIHSNNINKINYLKYKKKYLKEKQIYYNKK